MNTRVSILILIIIAFAIEVGHPSTSFVRMSADPASSNQIMVIKIYKRMEAGITVGFQHSTKVLKLSALSHSATPIVEPLLKIELVQQLSSYVYIKRGLNGYRQPIKYPPIET